MRFDFNKKFVRNFPFDGFVMDDKQEPMTTLKMVLIAIFNTDPQQPLSSEVKMQRFNIGRKLLVVAERENKVAELTAEEVVVIKSASTYLPPAIYGQVTEFVENPVQELEVAA